MMEEAFDVVGALLTAVAPAAFMPLLTKNAGGRPPLDDADAEKLLASTARRAIYDAILAAPEGRPVGEIARELHMGSGTFQPHFQRLVRAGLVETRRVGKHTFAYPAGKAPPDVGVLAQPTSRRIAEVLVERESLTMAQLAEEVGTSRVTVFRHLRRLTAAGYVLRDPGPEWTFSATPALRKALQDRPG